MQIATQVQIPLVGSITTRHAGLAELFRFERACEKHHNCTVFVDTQRMSWLDANLCAVVQAIFYRLFRTNGLQFEFDRRELNGRLAIFARNGFIGAQDLKLTDGYGSTVQLRDFSKDEDDTFIDYIENQLLAHNSLQLSDAARYDMTHNFTEVFTNVNQHAATEAPVFTCGQYYHLGSRLRFSLVDIGVGYLRPINQQLPHIITDAAAIQWAIQGGNTTRLPEQGSLEAPGGYGLTNLLAYCRANKGEMHIISGNAFWTSNNPAVCQSIEPFQGSVVNISLPCPKNISISC